MATNEISVRIGGRAVQMRTGAGGVAQTAAARAETAKAAAEQAKVAAESVAGPNYPNQAAGEAATTTGQQFKVVSGGLVSLYERTVGGSTLLYTQATTAALAATTGAGLIGTADTRTLADLLAEEQTAAQLSVQTKSNAALGGMHCYSIDSLFDGAGGGTPRTTMDAVMRGNLDYGGPGYVPFANAQFVTAGFSWSHSGAESEFGLVDGGGAITAYGQYSPSGEGQAITAAGGTFQGTPPGAWRTARVYFLKGPTLGAFKWRFTTVSPVVYTTVDCYAATWQLAYIDITNPSASSNGLAFYFDAGTTNPTGETALFGADWVYDATKFRPCNLARAGRKLKDVALMNATAQQAFYASALPKLIYIDGGMNDRTTRTAAQFETDLTTFVTNIQTGAPNCAVVIVDSLAPSDAATSNWKDYPAKRRAVAAAKGCIYVNSRDALGLPDYTTANALGFMFGDGIHPAAKGCIGNAISMLRKVGANLAVADPGAVAYAGGGGGTKVWRGSLTTVDGAALTAPVAAATGGSATCSGTTMTVTVAPTVGAFAVGQSIVGTGFAEDTVITALGTGTGGTGTYTLSTSQAVASAAAITGYTTTRKILWKIGLTNGYPVAVFDFNIKCQRTGTGAVRWKRVVVDLKNDTVANQALRATSTVPAITEVWQSVPGDFIKMPFIFDVTINANWAEIGITPTRYGGAVSAQGSYEFTTLVNTGQSVFEN